MNKKELADLAFDSDLAERLWHETGGEFDKKNALRKWHEVLEWTIQKIIAIERESK